MDSSADATLMKGRDRCRPGGRRKRAATVARTLVCLAATTALTVTTVSVAPTQAYAAERFSNSGYTIPVGWLTWGVYATQEAAEAASRIVIQYAGMQRPGVAYEAQIRQERILGPLGFVGFSWWVFFRPRPLPE